MKLFKVLKYFSYKDPIPDDFKSFLVYKFTRASCISSYICDTCRHFKTRIEEHIKKDNKSLHSTATCFDSYNSLCFKIIDKANTKFDYSFCLSLFFSVFVCLLFVCLFCVSLSSFIFIISDTNYQHLLLSRLHFTITSSHYKHLVSHFSLSSIVFIISTLIIGMFYCLNCISLLLHLIATHLVTDFIITM